MKSYRNILLFCDEKTAEVIAGCSEIPGISFIKAKDINEFSAGLEKNPDAVIVAHEKACAESLETIRKAEISSKTAVLLNGENTQISSMLDSGIHSFLSTQNLCSPLNSFLENIVLLGKKPDILMRTLNRLKNLANNTSEGIIILDDNAQVSYANSSVLSILNMEKSDVMKKTVDEIFYVHPLDLCPGEKNPVYLENYDFETSNGQKLKLNCTCSVNYENESFAGVVLIFSPVSSTVMDKQRELELLKYQQRYHSSQQTMAFKKQMLVLKDDVSNVMAGDFAVETYFKPLDVLSGDIYGSINIKDGRYLFYIVDAMGKGLSASVTSLQSSSFINHSLELSMIKNDFDMDRTLSSFLYYIRARLMDEEALCAVFALMDINRETISVANYGMPPVHLVDRFGEVESIRANNLPIMKCLISENHSTHSLKNVDKILILSDGLTESETNDKSIYSEYLTGHLKKAESKKHMLNMINSKITSNEDDITFFFIKKTGFSSMEGTELTTNSTLENVAQLSTKLTEMMIADNVSESDVGTVEYAVSEILMNALEHGNIGLGFEDKQNLIAKGVYDSYLIENTSGGASAAEKKIRVKYIHSEADGERPARLLISITDEGAGFIPADIFKYHSFDGNLCHVDRYSYNGRGIFITDNLVDGLYYNEMGNTAYILKLLEDPADQ